MSEQTRFGLSGWVEQYSTAAGREVQVRRAEKVPAASPTIWQGKGHTICNDYPFLVSCTVAWVCF